MTTDQLTAYRESARVAAKLADFYRDFAGLTVGMQMLIGDDIPTIATAVSELADEVERLTGDNNRLTENYEMAKRIIHSAGGICRETLP